MLIRARARQPAWRALPLLLLAAAACQPTNQGYAPAQPIAYSHAVHAGGLQIPCMYCHYAAERGKYAGVPPASVCMNCHKTVLPDHPEVRKVAAAIEEGRPIPWVRVHRLPDHVAFNHSVHVRADVACQTCHGPIESMGRVEQWSPLTMGWCLSCHRERTAATAAAQASLGAPGGHVGTTLTDCATCHH